MLLGLLLLLVREVRRPPGPPEWGRIPRWPKRFRVAVDAIILLLGGVIFWAFLIEPNRLVLHEETIQLNNWPRELNGLKVAVLADIHAGGAFIDEKKLRKIVERTNQLQPELIVILGDYMSGDSWTSRRMEPQEFGPILKDLHAPLGVYSVLGNHDWWYSGPAVRSGLEQNGIRVLEDEAIQLNARGTSLWLVGLADLWTRPQKVEDTIGKVPEGQPVIALTHNPDIFPNVPQHVQILLAAPHTAGRSGFR